VLVATHWPRLRCKVSLMGVCCRLAALTRTRDCGSGLAERVAKGLSRRRALFSRKEVETRLNRVSCHHGIFVKRSCTAGEPFMSKPTVNKAASRSASHACRCTDFFPFALHSLNLHAMHNLFRLLLFLLDIKYILRARGLLSCSIRKQLSHDIRGDPVSIFCRS
jgi:hypothetical protein